MGAGRGWEEGEIEERGKWEISVTLSTIKIYI